eukprot:363759-Chlamydomonas_euryale.AAC.3
MSDPGEPESAHKGLSMHTCTCAPLHASTEEQHVCLLVCAALWRTCAPAHNFASGSTHTLRAMLLPPTFPRLPQQTPTSQGQQRHGRNGFLR